MNIDTQSVMDLIVRKIVQDKIALVQHLESMDAVLDFDGQQKLLREYQGGVQALHVLTGQITHDGKQIANSNVSEHGGSPLIAADTVAQLEEQLRKNIYPSRQESFPTLKKRA